MKIRINRGYKDSSLETNFVSLFEKKFGDKVHIRSQMNNNPPPSMLNASSRSYNSDRVDLTIIFVPLDPLSDIEELAASIHSFLLSECGLHEEEFEFVYEEYPSSFLCT